MKNIIIIGARGYRNSYGGWETFVTNLIQNNHDDSFQFYIPNLTHKKNEDKIVKEIDGVINPYLYCPKQGFATMFTFTIKAIRYFINYIKENNLKNCVILLLGCKVGPLLPFWITKLHQMGVKLIINPDGLEWTRAKWPWWIRKCFKISERYSIKYSDWCVCDSMAIKKYIDKEYMKYQTPSQYIAYGAYLNKHGKKNKQVTEFLQKHQIEENNYYLIVGRFIPENNYETMLKEFMKTKTKRDLVIISNVEKNKFYHSLEETTHFQYDPRIKFVGSMYDENTLLYLRENAYAYLHGHSAGGTNPSLLEALSTTKVNILYKVIYNMEVGLTSCLFFTKEENNLKKVIEKAETLTEEERIEAGKEAKSIIRINYTWKSIVNKYENLFNKLITEDESLKKE